MPEQVWAPTHSYTIAMDHHTTITTDDYTSPSFVSSTSTIAFTITHQEAGTRIGTFSYSKDLVVDRGKEPGMFEDFGVTSSFRKALEHSACACHRETRPVDACAALGYFQVGTTVLDESFQPFPLPAVLVRLLTEQDDRDGLTTYIRHFKEWMDAEYNCTISGRDEKTFPKTAVLIVAQPESSDEEVVIGGKQVKMVKGRFTRMQFPPPPATDLSSPGNRWSVCAFADPSHDRKL
ncbi:hypothetical protein PG994_009565 [Apiospora phragmitis]|uniref:Uncharacterized protein n=1 Tax=Apiospora phragmitis TaxID=2905665 RepID=A0ABR1U966_9PEZI